MAYLAAHRDQLDEDGLRRLATNPLRVLDSKNPALKDLIEAAPTIIPHLGSASRDHFEGLCAGLRQVGIPYEINPRLVRGLDYYNRTVFEWTTERLGAQGTVCAGGRYDGLVSQLGGRPTPAVGFAMGLERLVELLASADTAPPQRDLHLYVITVGDSASARALSISEGLRDALPGLRMVCHCGGGSFKSQFKRADRSGARFALILGDDELSRGRVGLKPLRTDGDQIEVPLTGLADVVAAQVIQED